MISFIFNTSMLWATPPVADKERVLDFHEAQKIYKRYNQLNWEPVFFDSGKTDWKRQWMLDGEFAEIKNTPEGMKFSAGPEEWNHAHHAVLWTKDSFKGDLKIEYDYTRLDDVNKWVNILYIQATGKGGAFSSDIMDWADYRKEPWMKHYFENMKLLHISYAAYGKDDNGVDEDYVRCRRYPKPDEGEFAQATQIQPDSFHSGLFRKGVTYHITALKKGDRLFFEVKGDGKETCFAWESPLIGGVTEGRIGLRHMWMKAACYKNFSISTLRREGMKKKILMLLLFVMGGCVLSYGDGATGSVKEVDGSILSFETEAELAQIRSSRSSYRQSDTLSLLGSHSLQWDWKAGAQLQLPLLNYYSTQVKLSPFDKDQCLVIWIFNERPSEGQLTLSLGKGGKSSVSCPFYLNFTGWRTAHIPISQMEGDAPEPGTFVEYEQLKIAIASDHPQSSGRFFIDDVYTTMIDARHPSADYQTPYVKCFFNGEAHVSQWLDQKELPEKSDLIIKQIPVARDDLEAFKHLYDAEVRSLTQGFDGLGLSDSGYQTVRKKFENMGIRERKIDGKNYLQGPYIALKGQGLPANIYAEGLQQGRVVPLAKFEKTLLSIAQAYRRSTEDDQRLKLEEMFILATRAYLQSGWASGSNMGALHHLGYNNRKIAPAFFMMKKALAEAGLLQAVSDSLNWFAVAHVLNDETDTDPDLDLFNTVLNSHYVASMMHPRDEDAARHAKLLAAWLSRTFADYRKHGGFRHDGTAWHHWGHYPAYTKGAIANAVKVSNALTLAGFPLSLEGHTALQKAVKTIMLYQQGNRYPRSLCGRHPLTGSHRSFITANYTEAFVNLTPIDSELQRLHDYHQGQGEVSGNWTLPYSAMSLHRRDDYLAAVRGFGLYTWSAECYNFNRFGRYQSYGTLDLLYKDEEALEYEGYDWNLNPGTTITYLPLKELEAPIPIWMVVGTSRFANGVHDAENKNGAHGFDLDDRMLLNIDPGYEEIFTKEKLTARKSTFFMDDLILCLGSGISGQHEQAPVYTVLTQKGIESDNTASVNGKKISYPFKHRWVHGASQALFDGDRTGYLLLENNDSFVISKKEQVSRGDEMTFVEERQPEASPVEGKVNRRRLLETRGDFLSAYIDHGVQPINATYSYIIFPSVDESSFFSKAKKLYDKPEDVYRILSSAGSVHAVHDVRNATDTYICYEAQEELPHVALRGVSGPSLIILKKCATGYSVSAAVPDLHQPAFSREHKKPYYSQLHNFQLVFEGAWTVDGLGSKAIDSENVDGQTLVRIGVQHGVSYHFKLAPQ